MDKKYVEELWKLSRKLYRKKYFLSKLPQKNFIYKNKPCSIALFCGKKDDILVYESHSQRSAWLYKPWGTKKAYYPGLEYKGIGYQGKTIRLGKNYVFGGMKLDNAISEFNFSKLAVNSGVLCQRPVAVYSCNDVDGVSIGAFVRASISAIRLSELFFSKDIFSEYLLLRNETYNEYCDTIAQILGKNLRLMFDKGIYHGAMEMNNITTEGEILDFDTTQGGTWEGLMLNSEPRFRALALQRFFAGMQNLFGTRIKSFIDNFSSSFFEKSCKIGRKNPAKDIVSKYIGRKLSDAELAVEMPRFPEKEKIIQILKKERKKFSDKEQLKKIDYILKKMSSWK